MQTFLWISGNSQKRESLVEEAKNQVSQFDLFYNNCSENSSIEVVRELQRFLSRKPLQSKYNLGLFSEAHLLSLEAQNALLKTLEEPPQNSHLILIAPSATSLLPTIASRCSIVESEHIKERKEIDWELVKKVTLGGDSLRLREAEELDIDNWIYYWQQLLKDKVNKNNTRADISLTVKQINDYLKKLLKLSSFRENHVNNKLLASVILLSAPKETS